MGMEYVPMLIVAHTHFHVQEIHGWARVVAAYACASANGGTLVSFHGCRCGFGLRSWRRLESERGWVCEMEKWEIFIIPWLSCVARDLVSTGSG